eukprot:409387_1
MLPKCSHLLPAIKNARRSHYYNRTLFPRFAFSNPITQSTAAMSSLSSSLHSGLDDLQIEFQKLALDFTNNELKPYAKEWDKNKCVSYDTIRKAASLGFGG